MKYWARQHGAGYWVGSSLALKRFAVELPRLYRCLPHPHSHQLLSALKYLSALYDEYERFVADISRTIPVIRVDWDQFRDAEEMAEVIEREYLNSSFLRNVEWTPTRT